MGTSFVTHPLMLPAESPSEAAADRAAPRPFPVPDFRRQLDGSHSLSWAKASEQAQPRVGLQPHEHDRLHHFDGLFALLRHHAASPRLGRLPADASAQLLGMPVVQPH